MATWTVGPLTPVDMPYSDLGSGTAKSFYMARSDPALASELLVNQFVLSVSGTITIQADASNDHTMIVRSYHRPGFDWHDLGTLEPGESATFPIEYNVLPAESEIDDFDKFMYDVYMRLDPSNAPVRFTVTDFSISYVVTDVQPTSAFLIETADPTLSSEDSTDLRVDNMITQATINGAPIQDWLNAGIGRVARIQLDGDLQPLIGTVGTDENIQSLFYSGIEPGTYTQPYKVRLFNVTSGGEGGGGSVETEITEFDEGSDPTGVVSFTLIGDVPVESPTSGPWWLCKPNEPLPAPPERAEGFVAFADYDADFKYPLASSRVPKSTEVAPLEEGCHGCAPDIVHCD